MSYAEPSIFDLPELPITRFCQNGKLGQADAEPVIMFIPNKALVPDIPQPPEDPRPAHHCPPNAEYAMRKYLTQATYPKIICHELKAPTGQVVTNAAKANDAGLGLDAPGQRPAIWATSYYKLSELEGRRLTTPRLCSVFGGPWAVHVTSEQGCRTSCTPVPTKWKLNVPSFPEIHLEWHGTWEDAPLGFYPNLQILSSDLALISEARLCCKGFKRCGSNGACVRESLCDDSGPIDSI